MKKKELKNSEIDDAVLTDRHEVFFVFKLLTVESHNSISALGQKKKHYTNITEGEYGHYVHSNPAICLYQKGHICIFNVHLIS